MGSGWASPSRRIELKRLWLEGKTLTEIGDEMGETRSAIAGALKRTGISDQYPRRDADTRRRSGRRPSTPRQIPQQHIPSIVPTAPPLPPPPSKPIGFSELREGLCHYIVRDAPTMYCGAETEGHDRFCSRCKVIVYHR